ncbi:juvenile hormone acid O-methyltransferase-like [Dermacentor albipictus]|uniref:juvenile hormone acid O-methyltransferase-like n=1 Tax=Dermacentor albipictus TaxID=60249 RepID=UPI0038FCF9EA
MDKAASFPLPLNYIQQEYSNYASWMAWLSQEQVLELGCGPGLISRQVLQPLCEAHFARLLAVDRASEAILYAQQHSHHRDITYRHVPDLHTSVPVELQGAFSKLFHYGGALPCSEVNGLRQASLLLDIQGCCVLLLPVRCCLFDVLEQLSSSPRWKAYMRDAMHLVPPQSHWQEPVETFRKEAEQAGMEVRNVKLDTTKVTFNSSGQFQEFLSWAIPFVARIPMENRQAFLDEALALSFERGVQMTSSGKLQLSIALLSTLCTKVRNI